MLKLFQNSFISHVATALCADTDRQAHTCTCTYTHRWRGV